MPKVSVITPCYNSAKFVGRTIESVRAQTLCDWEHIVVDDGSADNAAEVIAPLLTQEPRLRLLRQPNGGVANARNNGYKACSQESAYLLFLDADDVLEPTMLAALTAYLQQHAEVAMAYCGHIYIDEDDRIIPEETSNVGWSPRYVPDGLGVRILPPDCPETPFISLYTLAGIIPSLTLMRRAIYAQTPGWDEDFGQFCEDTDIFLQMALRGPVHFVPEKLLRHRRHAMQNTANQSRMSAQAQKLYAKWAALPGLTEEQKTLVRTAERFREGRLLPYLGLCAGHCHLRQGQLGQAARFYGGAARRYLASFVG